MGWIEFESFWLGCPYFADVFVWSEAADCLQASRKIVCRQEIVEMCVQLVMAVVVEPFDRGIFDRSVHALDLAVRPGMTHFGQPMVYTVFCASHSKHMG